MSQSNKTLDDFYFISNVCTGDFVNKALNIQKLSPMNTTASDELDFLQLIDNYQDVDFDLQKAKIIQYSDAKVIQHGYVWEKANKDRGIDTTQTFGIEYPYKNNIELRQQLFYRHYEFNETTLQKIQRRIDRYKTTKRIPFFILHFSPGLIPRTTYTYRDYIAQLFCKVHNQNSLFISADPICLRYVPYNRRIYTKLRHEPIVPIVLDKLKKSYKL